MSSQVVLSTVQVLIQDKEGKQHHCRALLDSASQSSFMTLQLANILNLDRKNVDVVVNGLAQIKTDVTQLVSTTIKSRYNDFTIGLEFYVVPRISDRLPNQFIDYTGWMVPPHIKLADKRFNIPDKIDLLLGADVFFKILRSGQYVLPNSNMPLFQETLLGWVVAGRVPQQCHNFFLESQRQNEFDEVKLDDAIQNFWKIESIDCKSLLTSEEKQCEQMYDETYQRNEFGRFIVNLPLKNYSASLGESFNIAVKRCHYIENKLAKHPDLKRQYVC